MYIHESPTRAARSVRPVRLPAHCRLRAPPRAQLAAAVVFHLLVLKSACVHGLQRHLSASLTPASADSMCWPQPCQVGFWHASQVAWKHMLR